MVLAPKVILAADESTGTMGDRLKSVGLENTLGNREAFRRLIFSAPVGEYIAATILYEETLENPELVGLLLARGIIPGIKIDKGLADYGTNGEKIIKGFGALELKNRLALYAKQGARFTKFRSLFSITVDDNQLPTRECILINAFAQAEFARLSQAQGLVPIVEPEIDFKGAHSIDVCEYVAFEVLRAVFDQLERAEVDLDGMILKPSMVTSGQSAENRAHPNEVAERTLRVILDIVSSEVPGIAFLSGGQTDDEADANLAAISRHAREQMAPHRFAASFGRGLQRRALEVWGGKPENYVAAQEAFREKCRQTSQASVA